MKALLLVLALALSACSTSDYAKYAEVHAGQAAAEVKRLEIIGNIARESSDPVARVAAIMALNNAGQGSKSKPEQMTAPVSPITTVVDAGVSIYSLWAGGILSLAKLGQKTVIEAVDPYVLNNGLSLLKPNLK